MERRLFIISNRLPVNIETHENEISVNISGGGLVTAISGYLDQKEQHREKEFDKKIWIGVPGCTANVWTKVQRDIPAEGYEYVPVFINKKSFEAYYNGMSNSVLWALFHYFPSFADFNSNYYEQYQKVNHDFLDVLMRYLQPNDTVWIHDYHLLPLAGLIRKHMPEITIGFFLHIPFPSFEIFRIMPKRWQRQLLEGMLGADLLGFHTMEYTTHFLKSVQMILGLEHDKFVLRYNDRIIRVGVFPISIDFEKFNDAYDLPQATRQRNQMRRQFAEKKIIFSADRLDYTKGVQNRLKGYEYFLKQHPEYHEKVVFVMIIVPSRDALSKYAERKKMIDEYIGSLNSRVGNFKWQPVIYQYNSLDFEDLIAMYTSCDLALITPIRDGMNLVAKEFVASRKDEQGVLVLSEMTGAAKELTEALTINPTDIEEISEKIKIGLEMSEEEQKRRIKRMQERIKKYDVADWAGDFFDQLKRARQERSGYEVRFLDTGERNEILYSYANAEKRLLLLDYDGTLAPLVALPEMAKPDERLLDLLKQLSDDQKNTVYIISGRDASTLDNWLGHLPLNIIAEHGALVKKKEGEWTSAPAADKEWLGMVNEIMQKYAQNCPGAFVENKTFSVAWHYRNALPEQAFIYVNDLVNEINVHAASYGIQVIKGNKVVEVRSKGINKGHAVKHVLSQTNFDFVLACGDDTTDEDMFYQLAGVPEARTIKVGTQASYAKYNLHTTEMILSLLHSLSNAKGKNANVISHTL